MENMHVMKKDYILGIAGSIRSNFKDIEMLKDQIVAATDRDDLANRIDALPRRFSNSDIALAFALFGSHQRGQAIEMISIAKIFKHFELASDRTGSLDEHFERIRHIDFLQLNDIAHQQLKHLTGNAAGIILGSPVYFGDRSSVANKFMQLTNNQKYLKNKVFGMVAVGAKRNGGQETTCIYGLYDALMQEAIGVGNGPETSQYGGTVVAGDLHSASRDSAGLDRCYEVGQRVAAVASIINHGRQAKIQYKRLKIKVLITMDTSDRRYQEIVTRYFSSYRQAHEIDIINLIDFDIDRCVACGICPSQKAYESKNERKRYVCAIQTKRDSLDHIHAQLVENDCIVIVGVNSRSDLIYRYQAFTERTRYLRRDDFQLTNTCIISMFVNEVGSINNSLHPLKVLTSYIRHNTIVFKPLEIICHGDRILYKSNFSPLIPTLQCISTGRTLTPAQSVSYTANGYSEDIVNNTSALRK
jgi:multimeric flavodoxin WrbA